MNKPARVCACGPVFQLKDLLDTETAKPDAHALTGAWILFEPCWSSKRNTALDLLSSRVWLVVCLVALAWHCPQAGSAPTLWVCRRSSCCLTQQETRHVSSGVMYVVQVVQAGSGLALGRSHPVRQQHNRSVSAEAGNVSSLSHGVILQPAYDTPPQVSSCLCLQGPSPGRSRCQRVSADGGGGWAAVCVPSRCCSSCRARDATV